MRMIERHESAGSLPVRPFVPPVTGLAIGMCVSCAFMLDAGWTERVSQGVATLLTGFGLAAVALVLFALGAAFSAVSPLFLMTDGCEGISQSFAGAFVTYCAVGIVAGVGSSALWLSRRAAESEALRGATLSEYELVVCGDARKGSYGFSSDLEVREPEKARALARVSATFDREYCSGTTLHAVGRFEPLGDDEWAKSRYMKGQSGSVHVSSVLDSRAPSRTSLSAVRGALLSRVGPGASDARALLAGTVCGRTTELAQAEVNEAFSRCGLSHLIAVSGSHLAFIAALIEFLLGRTRMGAVRRQVLLIVIMALYVVFTGGAPSALRSVSMVALASAAVLGGRRPHAVSGLVLVIALMVLFDPGVVFDLGFQLSAMSVLFILLFGSYTAYALKALGAPRGLADVLSITLVAQWATLPVTIPVFGEISLVAPVANLLVGPLMSGLLVVGLIAVPLSVLLPIPDVVLAVPDFLANASAFAAHMLAGIPYASIAVEAPWWLACAAYGVAVVVYVMWPRLNRGRVLVPVLLVSLACSAHVVHWSLLAPPCVTVMDVGQGDSILIRDGFSSILVDAGVDEATRSALARNNVWHLDAVVITHWDRDHWGGLPEALAGIQVDRLVVAQGAARALPDELSSFRGRLAEVRQGDVLSAGGFTCKVVWPESDVAGEENAESLCLDVAYERSGKSLHMLLTGDTERDELERYAASVGDIDVLKVGHHGSRVSLSSDALAALDPELSIASAGEGNSYGHPDPACIRCARESGSAFVCTMDVGDVTVCPAREGATVHVQNDGALKG